MLTTKSLPDIVKLNNDSLMTRQELIAEFMSVAHQTVWSRNCKFSSDAEANLLEMVSSAVNNTMTEADVNNPVQIARAESNMRELCYKLCERTKSDNKFIVENRTFSYARMSICPIWPFC